MGRREAESGEPNIAWLLDSDPSIRWQVMRDLLDLPEAEWSTERARVEHEGWGAELLAHQDPDGMWAGGAFAPRDFDWDAWQTEGQPWTATCFSLQQLREFGFDPTTRRAQDTVELIHRNGRWDHAGQPYWDGEVEECINGRTVADGAYFGVDVSSIVARLVSHRLPDGGWNCERERGSRRSSFDSTINVLEGLLEFERATGGTAESRLARRDGEDYLLERHLFRGRTSGEVAAQRFLEFAYPHRWRYDLLRALDYFRFAGVLTGQPPDPRLAEAIDYLRTRRRDDGRWCVDAGLSGRVWFDLDAAPGDPSRWLTLKALRVLRWWDAGTPTTGS